MQVETLRVYPVKAMQGFDVAERRVERPGLAGDRRLMLVDGNGRFITQREEPRLASVRVAADVTRIEAPGLGVVPLPEPAGPRVAVTVWKATVDAIPIDAAIDQRLSSWLGRPVRLVAMDAESRRNSNPDWAPDAPVSFADGFPVLIATTASLDALNGRICERGGTAVPMARFRPNVVVGGAEPWAEDRWAAVRVGEVVFDLVKPCERCIVTTTDQEDGSRPDDEPIATLSSFRRSRDPRIRGGVLFGWNAVPRDVGTLRRGDAVEVVALRDPWPVG